MTVFSGGQAIKEFLSEFDNWLSESVTVYLLGGSAMTRCERKPTHSRVGVSGHSDSTIYCPIARW